MATLTYWFCECLNDHPAYNIRTTTKKEAKAVREQRGEANYSEPQKAVIYYDNAFDLMKHCMGEGSGSDYAASDLE